MKQYSSIPPMLWYAPAVTGISYLIVFILFILLPGSPADKQAGDIIFSIGQMSIPFSMLLFHKLNLTGPGFWKKFSLAIPVAGSLSYVAGIVSFFTGNPVIILFPLGALLIGLGMLIIGVQVIKTGKLKQWKRFTPLLVGLYPFLIMFPIVFITGSPSIYAIMLWGIPWKIMGCALLSELYAGRSRLVSH